MYNTGPLKHTGPYKINDPVYLYHIQAHVHHMFGVGTVVTGTGITLEGIGKVTTV